MKSLLIESNSPILQDYYSHFLDFTCEALGIPECPPVKLVSKTGSSSFGNYNLFTKVITVATDGRHVADILRTLAHELVHEAQHMNGDPTLSLEQLEYEANAVAGMIMRDYNKLHPELYDADEDESPDQLDDSGNPGAAQGSLENSGVTVDAFQTPSYEEGGLDDGQPMRPPYPIEMAEEAPVNAVSSGGVEGIGFGPKGEPGFHPTRHKKGQVLKRKTLKQFKHGLTGGSL